MAGYASGQQTRQLLVDAAGELAAEVGITNVSTRAVADRAGQNIGSIHYHFKSKDGLFEAVLRTVTEKIRENLFLKTFDRFEDRLNSPRGQSMALQTIIKTKIGEVFAPEKPWWHSRVVFQVLSSEGRLRDILHNEVVIPDIETLKKILKIVNPEFDEDELFVHAMLILTPIVFHAESAGNVLKLMGKTSYSPAYLKILGDTMVHQVLTGLGLPPV